MNKKKKIIFISLGAIAVIAILVLVVCFLNVTNDLKKSEKEMQEFEELIALEKEEALNDLHDLQIKFEEEKEKEVVTEELLKELEEKRDHVMALQDELKKTKATSAAEIKRLKKELSTLREVLADYSRQIDELYRENTDLKNENKKLIAGKKKAEQEKINLQKDKKALEQIVDIASQLNATNTKIETIRGNGKKTKHLRSAKQFKVSCTISRNITASTGYKVAYVRITQPDGELLTKDIDRDTFKFQNQKMGYSMCKEFEHTGEEQSLVFYWDVEDAKALQDGNYHVSIIVDDNIIGEGSAYFD